MIALAFLAFGAAVLLCVATVTFWCRVVRMHDRILAVATCLNEARVPAETRARIRRRRKRMHDAVATGATGLEIAHRATARYFGGPRAQSSERLYEAAREINRGVDSVLTAVLSPRNAAGPSASARRRGRDTDD